MPTQHRRVRGQVKEFTSTALISGLDLEYKDGSRISARRPHSHLRGELFLVAGEMGDSENSVRSAFKEIAYFFTFLCLLRKDGRTFSRQFSATESIFLPIFRHVALLARITNGYDDDDNFGPNPPPCLTLRHTLDHPTALR